jgi:cellulase/cellobiase CelA1
LMMSLCQSSDYWWDWFHKKFVTLDGNSYADLAAAKAAGAAVITYGI